ncbi:MAG: hypothetical protein WA623_14675 [Candidatus Sulfotelmatobacter sp.]
MSFSKGEFSPGAASESIGNHATDVVTHNVNLLQMQLFRQLVNIFRHIRSVVAAGTRGGTTDAAQIHCNDRKLLRQVRHDLMKLVPVFGKAIQQEHRWSDPAAHEVESCPFTCAVAEMNPPPSVASAGSGGCFDSDRPAMAAHAATTLTATIQITDVLNFQRSFILVGLA